MQLKPFVLSFLLLPVLRSPAQAQIIPANDGTNTVVSNTLNITGGTPSGSSLFHSFQTFGVNAGQTATFQSNPAIQNILGRVVGGNSSVINGAIQVIGGSTNLYLMNPAGIIFGQGASLNVTGAFTATTATAIGFGDGKWFNAVGTNNYGALVGNPGDFAFTNQPGGIFNSANLAQKEGQSITLVGGTVVSTGTLTAPGGKITIATVPGNKLVRISDSGSVLSLDLPIASKQQINAPSFTPLLFPKLLTGSDGTLIKEASGVTVENGVVKLTGSSQAISSGDIVTKAIDTSNTTGNAGNINITSNGAIRVGGAINANGFSSFGNTSPANGGTVSIKAQTEIITGEISTSTSALEIKNFITFAGDVSLSTQTGDIIIDSVRTGAANSGGGGGKGGDFTVDAARLFRAIGEKGVSISTGGNVGTTLGPSNQTGLIKITHGGTDFVVGGTANFDPANRSNITATLINPFVFPENASGTRGAIGSATTNGNYRVVFQDGGFYSGVFDGTSVVRSPVNPASGFQITSVSRPKQPPDPKQPQQPDPQSVQRQFTRKTGKQCDTGSTTVASNSPASQRGTTASTDPCSNSSNEGNVLQVIDK